MKSLAVLLACASSMFGCAAIAAVTGPEEAHPGQEYRMAVDDDFAPEDRAEIEAGVEQWRSASAGQMNVRLVGEDEPADGHVRKGVGPDGIALSRRTLEVWIDVDRLHALDQARPVRAVVMHCEGRLFGISNMHNPTEAVMNGDSIADELTETDLQACRDAGFCE